MNKIKKNIINLKLSLFILLILIPIILFYLPDIIYYFGKLIKYDNSSFYLVNLENSDWVNIYGNIIMIILTILASIFSMLLINYQLQVSQKETLALFFSNRDETETNKIKECFSNIQTFIEDDSKRIKAIQLLESKKLEKAYDTIIEDKSKFLRIRTELLLFTDIKTNVFYNANHKTSVDYTKIKEIVNDDIKIISNIFLEYYDTVIKKIHLLEQKAQKEDLALATEDLNKTQQELNTLYENLETKLINDLREYLAVRTLITAQNYEMNKEYF